MSDLTFSVKLPDGSDKVLYKPSPKQLLYHQSSAPNLIAIGNRGGGKSLMLRYDAHIRALSVPNCNVILIRKTYTDLLKTHLIYLPEEMDFIGGSYHSTNHIAYYPNGSRMFLSYVGTDAMNLLGAEFLAAYYDELSVIPWEFFTKLNASVRVPKSSGLTAVIRAATNPLGESTEDIWHYFVDHDVDPELDPDYNPADWEYMQINMEDNPHLDVEQYRKRFAGLPAHIRKAWLEGVFSPEHGIFDFYPTRDGRPWHVIHDLDLPEILKHATIYRTLDAGWFPDPTVCIWIAHLGNRFIAFHEKTWYKTVAADIARDIKEADEMLGIKKVPVSLCDPTMDINTTADVRTIKDIYEECGISLECSINDRAEFARVINSALTEQADEQTPRLQVYVNGRDGCPNLAKTIPLMRFHPKHPEKMDDHKQDHWCVALAYFLISGSSAERKTYEEKKVRPWLKPKTGSNWVLGSEGVKEPSRL